MTTLNSQLNHTYHTFPAFDIFFLFVLFFIFSPQLQISRWYLSSMIQIWVCISCQLCA